MESFIPRDRLPLAFAPFSHSFQRRTDAIRIVETLKAGNALRAKGSSIDRVQGISSDVDSPSVNHPDQDATAAHALTADRWNPSFNPGLIGFLKSRKLRPLPKATA
jgi:hypothetical protein